MKLEAYKIFDGPDAITDELRAVLKGAFHALAELDPMGDPGGTYWLNAPESIADTVSRAELKLEYFQRREEIIGTKQTKEREFDLVETRSMLVDWTNGLLLLEDRYFRERGDLTKQAALDRLNDLIARACGAANLEALVVLPLRITRESSDLRELYFRETVTHVVIQNLFERLIPENVKIYNPREDHEQFIRELLEEETRIIDEVEITAAAGKELAGSHFTKAAILTGDPSELGYLVEQGQPDARPTIRVVKTARDEPVEIELTMEAPNADELLRALEEIQRTIETAGLMVDVRIRVQPRKQQGLFDGA